MKILITGPVGSGKTTQAKILAQKFNLCFISGGDLARSKAAEKSSEGRRIKQAMKNGRLIDDKIEAQLVKASIAGKCLGGFVLDGYPRSLNQLNFFNPGFEKVFLLDISDQEAEKRLILRGRGDDKPEVIKERLGIYHRLTQPVIEYYTKLGKVVKINGTKNIQDIAKEIEQNTP